MILDNLFNLLEFPSLRTGDYNKQFRSIVRRIFYFRYWIRIKLWLQLVRVSDWEPRAGVFGFVMFSITNLLSLWHKALVFLKIPYTANNLPNHSDSFLFQQKAMNFYPFMFTKYL